MSTARKPWDRTWNPLTGCEHCSPGCVHCWAEVVARRFPQSCGGDFTPGRFHARRLLDPLRWVAPEDGSRDTVFAVNLGDLFHRANDRYAVAAVWGVMLAADWHDFHVVTKRLEEAHAFFAWLAAEAVACNGGEGVSPGRFCVWAAVALADVNGLRLAPRVREALERAEGAAWPPRHVTVFATCESQPLADRRVPLLLGLPVGRRGVYAEPLLGELSLARYLPHGFVPGAASHGWERQCDALAPDGMRRCGYALEEHPRLAIDQVIAGGETGAGARPCDPDWLHALRDECAGAGVPFTLKQYGPAPRGRRPAGAARASEEGAPSSAGACAAPVRGAAAGAVS